MMNRFKTLLFMLSAALLLSCGASKKSTSLSETQENSAKPPAYSARIGLGVSTKERTCMAIQNANVPANTAVTLIAPTIPQTFTNAEVTSTSQTACPVTENVDPSVTNYDLQVQNKTVLTKLVPFVAVVAPPANFRTGPNNDVLADIDGSGKSESFRACSAANGLHLTVWLGQPLSGTLLWHGFYYQPENTIPAPACSPKETIAP
ncbi:MAG: hypothetical protein JO217_00070 [Acidobacteriaceae bacterium]|nr:hypothetical protein [Acidobacteriaceae bacterium]MBV9441061.1 hypothetical protein [Acidobacteriaceae bacterium]